MSATTTPSTIFRAIAALATDDEAARARAALRTALNERGHGSVEELRAPLGVSRGSFHDWRSGKVPVSPMAVYRIAVIYSSDPMPTTPEEVDALIATGDLDRADELFQAFYSANHRDALTWLLAHNPAYFRWSDQVPAA
jgi:hypothetical protein